MPSDLEKAWVAGLFDGDGCVTLSTTGDARPFRKPLIVVDSTDIEILRELIDLYGGSLIAKRRTSERHRQAWSWRIFGANKIRQFLLDILPFMRCSVKTQRARMLVHEFPTLTPRNGYYSAQMRELKLDFERRFFAVGFGRGAGSRLSLDREEED